MILSHNSQVYCHNLKYDLNFFAKYGMKSGIEKGNQIYKATINHSNKKITFVDSAKIITMKLKEFSKAFGLKE